jgi:hypothetical protein
MLHRVSQQSPVEGFVEQRLRPYEERARRAPDEVLRMHRGINMIKDGKAHQSIVLLQRLADARPAIGAFRQAEDRFQHIAEMEK